MTMLAKLSSMRMMSQASLATSVPAIPCEETGVLSHLVGRPLHWQLTTTVHQTIHSTRNVLLSYHSHSQFDTLLIPILTALSYLICYHFPSIPILYYPPSHSHFSPSYHSKAHIRSLQCRSVISPITRYRDYLPVGVDPGLNDVVHQSVFVSGGGPGEDSQLWPDLVKLGLGHLEGEWEGGEGRGSGWRGEGSGWRGGGEGSS